MLRLPTHLPTVFLGEDNPRVLQDPRIYTPGLSASHKENLRAGVHEQLSECAGEQEQWDNMPDVGVGGFGRALCPRDYRGQGGR